jgi:redox-sensitive bicupin YhaK (pirin superfamily)
MPGDEHALPVGADARVLGATLKAGQCLSTDCPMTRHAYLVPTLGAVHVNGERVEAGDGIAMTDEIRLIVEAIEDTEVVLVEVF